MTLIMTGMFLIMVIVGAGTAAEHHKAMKSNEAPSLVTAENIQPAEIQVEKLLPQETETLSYKCVEVKPFPHLKCSNDKEDCLLINGQLKSCKPKGK